jgi:hypothetical protein
VLRHKEAGPALKVPNGGKFFMLKNIVSVFLAIFLVLSAGATLALEPITVALTSKAFQYVPLVIAQERGYMKEEGIDLKLAFMQNAPGLQALTANQVQFSGSGSSALVAISKGGARDALSPPARSKITAAPSFPKYTRVQNLNVPPRLHHPHFCDRLNCRFQIATLLPGYVLGHPCRESLTTRERDFSLAALSILGWPISCCG